MIRRWVDLLPDLLVCDIEPEELGLGLITELRDEAVLPILFLTSNPSDNFLLEAYNAGVDECVSKPIHPPVLEAKIKAWLRHASNVPVDVLSTLKVDDLQLIPSDRIVILDDRGPIHLTNLELRLLYYLMGRPGRTVTIEELCQHVWGQNQGDATTLKNLVYRLRRKIEADPSHPHLVSTVSGVGYRFLPKAA
jgi:DNA-binding response OmpR family regulator